MGLIWLQRALLALQGGAMIVDELYFHRRRGLPLWERLGHPIDTASVLACFALIAAFPCASSAMKAYLALAACSCLLVAKDEHVHAQHCESGEHRLHFVLFALHPLVLATQAALWPRIHPAPASSGAPDNLARLQFDLQIALAAGFFLYQTVYWNVYAARIDQQRDLRHAP